MITATLASAHSSATAAEESIGDRFSKVASRFSDKVAISSDSREWTYSELEQRSNSIALNVLEQVDKGVEAVALLMEHEAPLVAAILGVLKSGKLYLSLDRAQPAARLAAALNDSQARLLICDSGNLAQARSVASEKVKILEWDQGVVDPSAPGGRPMAAPPEAGAWLMYTSGSTGVPKGVWQNHRNVLHQADLYRELISAVPDDRFSLLTSCSLAASATHLFAALLSGARLGLFPVRDRGIDRLGDWLAAEAITIYHSVPTIFRRLMRGRGSGKPFETLRLLRLGGEAMLRTDVGSFRRFCPAECRLMNAFSSTETGLVSAFFLDRHTAINSEIVPIGKPVRGVEVLLLDEVQRPVAAGKEGRIAVRSRHLAQGYWRRPEMTHEVFHKAENGTRLFLSNDRGRLRTDGLLEHPGRSDHQIKIRGQRLDLGEVESALRQTGLFEESAVVCQELASGDRRLTAFFVPLNGADISPQGRRNALLEWVPEAFVPADFVRLETMPQTAGGKIDRRALEDLLEDNRPDRPFRAKPRDGVERKLARIWGESLGISEVGRDEDFFELGGDSLQSVQVLTRIEEAFSVALSPSALAENGTIEKLAQVIAGKALGHSHGPVVTLRTAQNGRPLFLIHNGQGNIAGYGQLARRLMPRPIYGFQAMGMRGESWPLMSIGSLARRYAREIVKIDPTGPYLLGGTCSGGMIVYEMGQQLIAAGRRVALLALFDVSHPLLRWKRPRWRDRIAGSFFHAVRDVGRVCRWSTLRALGLQGTARWLPGYRRFVANVITSAYRRYRPVAYPDTITLFLSSDKLDEEEDRRLILGELARSRRVVQIPGTRPEMFIPPSVDELARQLDLCLAAAENPP